MIECRKCGKDLLKDFRCTNCGKYSLTEVEVGGCYYESKTGALFGFITATDGHEVGYEIICECGNTKYDLEYDDYCECCSVIEEYQINRIGHQ